MIKKLALLFFCLGSPAMAQQSLTISGANPVTLTTSGTTNVTLPTSGTLLTEATAASTYAPINNPTFTGTFGATGQGAFGSTINSGAVTALFSENLASATNTGAEFVAETGTANANVALENLDGASPAAFLVSGSGDTGGLALLAHSGFIGLDSDTDFTGTYFFTTNGLFFSTLSPTIASGFGTSPSISANNGTLAFAIHIGTGGTASTGTLSLPGATHGWACDATDITTQSASVFITKQTAYSSNSVTLTQYNDAAAATPWTAGDTLLVKCSGF